MIRKGRAVSLSISFYSATISRKDIPILLRTRDSCDAQERNWIDDGTNTQLEFLFRQHWWRVPIIRAVKVGDDTADALLYGNVHLLLGQLLLVSSHRHAAGNGRDR